MRCKWANSLLTTAVAAALVVGVSVASAQNPGKGDGGQRMHQAPGGGGGGARLSGGSHVQSSGIQSRPAGFNQSRGPSSDGGTLHSERGRGFAAQRSMHGENLGSRGHTRMQTSASHGQRGHGQVAEQRRM